MSRIWRRRRSGPPSYGPVPLWHPSSPVDTAATPNEGAIDHGLRRIRAGTVAAPGPPRRRPAVAAHAARTLVPAQEQASRMEMAAPLDATDPAAAGDPSTRGGCGKHSAGSPMSAGARNRLLHKAVH